jgi:alkylhydroperoxidase family enzyme
MNWLTMVGGTVPKYAEDIATNLAEALSTDNGLTEIDSHACALAAAVATGNGGLGFEISMNGPLFKTNAREAAKRAAVLFAYKDTLHTFDSCFEWTGVASNVNFSDTGVTETQYTMYEFAAAVALKNNVFIAERMKNLSSMGVSHSQILAIARIAAVIATFTKIVV